jgi:hypothetical protein
LLKENRQFSLSFPVRGAQGGVTNDTVAKFDYELIEATLAKLGEPLFDLQSGARR